MQVNLDKIYICHHKKLVNRKNNLMMFFNKHGIDVEWVEKYPPEDILEQYNSMKYSIDDKNTELFYHMCAQLCLNKIKRCDFNLPHNIGKKITLSELSLYLKHKYCLEDQLQNKYRNILILEDDVILDDNFITYINRNLEEFDLSDSDILIVGETPQWNYVPINYSSNKLIHYSENQLTRCAHAIIYKLDVVKNIIDEIRNITFQWDFKLNEIMIKKNLRVSWSCPGILQGNQTSSIKK